MVSDDFPISLPVFPSPEEEREYWLSKTPWERIQAILLMNREKYGDAACDAPMERVLWIGTREHLKYIPLDDR